MKKDFSKLSFAEEAEDELSEDVNKMKMKVRFFLVLVHINLYARFAPIQAT